MPITQQLRQDHEALVELVLKFQEIIASSEPPAGVDLVKFRHAFSRQLLAHLAREDMLLYPTLRRSKNATIAKTAEAFVTEMGGLVDVYKQWSTSWPTERLTQEWPQFVEETASLLNALSQRIMRENIELYPLVEGDVPIAA